MTRTTCARYPGRTAGARVLLAFLLLAAFGGCLMEPERTNPADPNSPVFDGDGRLMVTVLDREDSNLHMALVRLQGYNQAQFTDANGLAVFEVPADTIYYIIERDQYVSQTGQVVVNTRQTTQHTVKLNGKPRIDSVSVRTRMIEEESDIFLYGYEFTVYTGDYDSPNDITDFEFFRPGDDVPIEFNADEMIVINQDVGSMAENLTDLLGRDFRFVLYDEAEDTAMAIEQINSFLHYEFLTDDMDGSGPFILGNMEFSWNNTELLWFTPDTYRLMIFESDRTDNPFIDTLIVFQDVEGQNELSVNITQTAGFDSTRTRWWQLQMYDKFGNYVQSLRKSFNPDTVAVD